MTTQARKEDKHVKALLGADFLADAVKHPKLKAIIRTTLDRAITNAKDRQLVSSKGHLRKDNGPDTTKRPPKAPRS